MGHQKTSNLLNKAKDSQVATRKWNNVNVIRDEGQDWERECENGAPYQFFSCNFYKCRN